MERKKWYHEAIECIQASKRENMLGNPLGALRLANVAYGITFSHLENQKEILKDIAHLIQRGYQEGTKPKVIRTLKRFASKFYLRIQETEEFLVRHQQLEEMLADIILD